MLNGSDWAFLCKCIQMQVAAICARGSDARCILYNGQRGWLKFCVHYLSR